MLALLDSFIAQASTYRVAVIGETIIDEFIDVSYEGQSMKSICPAFKLTGKKQRQLGGASAIANHLQDFVKHVELITNPIDQIVKTRYVDVSDGKKHVEINHFNVSAEKSISIDVNDYDVVIMADFGHGFCDGISINDGFHLMCQTNSNNFGFNRISKWKSHRNKSVCIDLREASLQMNKRAKFTDEQEISELYQYELNTENLYITLGGKGALAYDGKSLLRQDSFKSEIVDTIGAGDTFYSFVALASHFLPISERLIIPSLAASLSTTWLCNEQSVTQEKLKKYATQFIQ